MSSLSLSLSPCEHTCTITQDIASCYTVAFRPLLSPLVLSSEPFPAPSFIKLVLQNRSPTFDNPSSPLWADCDFKKALILAESSKRILTTKGRRQLSQSSVPNSSISQEVAKIVMMLWVVCNDEEKVVETTLRSGLCSSGTTVHIAPA